MFETPLKPWERMWADGPAGELDNGRVPATVPCCFPRWGGGGGDLDYWRGRARLRAMSGLEGGMS